MEGDLNILISLNTQFFHNDFDDDTKFGDSFHGELEGTANKDAEKVKTTLTRVCQPISRSSYVAHFSYLRAHFVVLRAKTRFTFHSYKKTLCKYIQIMPSNNTRPFTNDHTYYFSKSPTEVDLHGLDIRVAKQEKKSA